MNRFWDVFSNKLYASTASCASLIGLIFTLPRNNESLSIIHWALIIVAVTSFIINIKKEFASCPKVFNEQEDINKYMYNWISKGGRVAIFTRDMTWAENTQIKELLNEKAKSHELYIYLPEITHRISGFIKELKESGAEIFTYPELDIIPESRFTIINKDRADSQVAVGRNIKGKHTIEEFVIGEHPVFSIANDLTKVIYKHNKLMGRISNE